MRGPLRAAVGVGAIGGLSALVVWLVDRRTRVVLSVSPGLLVALATVLLTAGLLGWVLLRRRDDAAQRRSEERVAQVAQAVEARLGAERGRLLGRIDHELKNPVMATNLALDALRGATPGSEEAARAVATIGDQAARLGALLTSLRKIADIEHRDLDLETVDLGELLTAVRDACAATPNGIDRRWALNLPQAPWPLPPIEGDPDLLYLALYNLADNAVKYSGPGANVEIRAAEADGGIAIAVADTGDGIPAAEVHDVFDELARASTARGIPGQGLGLALVRSAIARHGGTVSLESRIGIGTSVSVWLPLHPPTEQDR